MLGIYTILDALNFVLFAVGAFICFRSFRAKKNTGHLVLITYFVLSFAFLGIARIRHARHDTERLRQARANPPAQGVAVPIRQVSLPIMPLLLVGGLWLICKDTNAKESESITNSDRNLSF